MYGRREMEIFEFFHYIEIPRGIRYMRISKSYIEVRHISYDEMSFYRGSLYHCFDGMSLYPGSLCQGLKGCRYIGVGYKL